MDSGREKLAVRRLGPKLNKGCDQESVEGQ